MNRDHVIGGKVKDIFRSKWEISTADRIRHCRGFVQLTSDFILELRTGVGIEESGMEIQEPELDINSLYSLKNESPFDCCIGETITHVVVTDSWPSDGFRLSNGKYLHLDVEGDAIVIVVHDRNDAESYIDFYTKKVIAD
jgi:hypothetical protein